MENILYNELHVREFDIDVGVVEVTAKTDEGKNKRVQYEVDFVANRGSKRYYIQSAFAIPDEEKRKQEIRPFTKIQDSYISELSSSCWMNRRWICRRTQDLCPCFIRMLIMPRRMPVMRRSAMFSEVNCVQ